MHAVTMGAHSWLRALTLALMMVTLACGDDAVDRDPIGPLHIDDGASNGVARSAVVRGDRDVTLNLRTGAALFIEAGAVNREVNVTIRRPKDTEALPLVASLGAGRRIASAPYVLTPHGENFAKDVRVQLPIAVASAGKLVSVAWLASESDTQWKVLGPAPIIENKVIVPLKHFSVLVLLEGSIPADDGGVVVPDGGTAPEGGMSEGGVSEGGAAMADGGVLYPDGGSDGGLDAALPFDGTIPVPADGATVSDATGPTGDGGAVDYRARMLTRFEQCELIARTGTFSFPYVTRKREDTCYLDCVTTVGCADLQAEWCGVSTSNPLIQCFARCLGFATVSCQRDDGMGLALFCDARYECIGAEDEANCEVTTDYLCSDGERIPLSNRCDGEPDCDGSEDELRCTYPASFFTCGDGTRLPPEFECDGEPDCANAEDERNCANKLFRCTDGSFTINVNRVCNTFRDCEDGSDEPTSCMAISCPADF